MEYYQNLIKDNAKKYSTSMEKAGEEASKGFAKGFKNVLNEVSNIMQKIGKVIGKMFSGAKGGLGKLFDLNPDTALEGLLKLEDKILTFFMETLPKIPQFIASALQSVSVMLSTIKLNIDKKQIKAMIKNIMATVKMFVPDILKIGLEIAREIVEGLAEGIKENAGLIGQVLNDMAQILAQYMPPVVLAIIDAVSKFISAIPDSAIMSLVNGAIDLVIKLASALINNAVAIAEKLIPALFEIILQLFKKLPEILKTVLWEVIKGLGKVASFIWEGVKKLFGFETGTNNAPKGLALVGEAGPELVNFKGGERILNARNTQRALEGATSGNAGNTFNVTFNNLQDTSAYAMMSQLRQYNRQLSINGVI
jgi:phage-related tail protein